MKLKSQRFNLRFLLLCLPLQVGNPEGNYIVPGAQGAIVYRRVEGRALALDAYVQRRGSRRPAVLVIHGGGGGVRPAGSRAAFIGQFLEMLTRAGYNWFAIDYRMGGPAESLDDARAALDFVRCHAAEFRIDPGRIAVLGEDTGARLAGMLAGGRPEGVHAAVLVGGVYEGAAESGAPATLVVHGAADSEVPPALAEGYCAALRGAGRRCDYLAVEGAIHRPENWRPEQWGYKARVIEWLNEKLGHERPDHEPYLTSLQKDIVYEARTGLRLDAYVPPGRGPFPAVILAHGGGWEAGDKVTYLTPILEPLSRAGFAWFSIDYRLTPQVRHPDQLDDLRAAIRFVREHAAQFRVDPRRLALVGESASGQMVTQVATERPAPAAAVVSFYGVYDFAPMVTDASPRSLLTRLFGLTRLDDEARVTLRRYSPLYHAHAKMPPRLLIHGTGERLWGQGVAMEQRLSEVGARHELYAVEGAPHGMENWEGRPEWEGYKQKLVAWLGAQLK
ncbi:MAG TPA: alpha/beta hydrolase fold domain-containing protein [Blastocatellia bacterium]|nr:alpha/beta hydrolase fold domain-containing protein [Blastocatellia bacterium]